ncbi:MAG: acyl-CoA dehydrogenase family protein, partial [Pseudonocardiaceae bacterium]
MRRRLFEAEHEAFRQSVRAFLAKEVMPHLPAWDAEGIVPRELFTIAGAAGFLGMAIPEELGGGGVSDFRFNVVLGEEVMFAGAAGAGLGLTLHNDICLPYFLDLATAEQQRRWLPGIASGELITAIAMTEPGMGSDLAGLATTAVRRSDHYLVNGSKTFITNGINADLVITAVKTDP